MAAAAPGPRLYRPRRPERTVLYRALADRFERFLALSEDRFQPTHGLFRRAVEKAAYRYLDCGIFAHGAARAHCADCGHDVLIALFRREPAARGTASVRRSPPTGTASPMPTSSPARSIRSGE